MAARVVAGLLIAMLIAAQDAGADEQLLTMPAEAFFRIQRVHEPLELSRIDERLLAAAIFHETNRRRKRSGLEELAPLQGLQEAAFMHARNMARGGYLSHDEPGDPRLRTPRDRVSAAGLRPSFVAENVATQFALQYASGTPFYTGRDESGAVRFSRSPGGPPIPRHTFATFAAAVLDEWMGSPGHRKNILSRQARFLGCAAARQEPAAPGTIEKLYCAQVFAAF